MSNIELQNYNGFSYFDSNGDLRYGLETSDGNLTLSAIFKVGIRFGVKSTIT